MCCSFSFPRLKLVLLSAQGPRGPHSSSCPGPAPPQASPLQSLESAISILILPQRCLVFIIIWLCVSHFYEPFPKGRERITCFETKDTKEEGFWGPNSTGLDLRGASSMQ